jgi:hypothetical protein
MKTLSIMLLIAALGTFSVNTMKAGQEKDINLVMYIDSGYTYNWKIDAAKIGKIPLWDGLSVPPLSQFEAIDIARKSLTPEERQEIELSAISLRKPMDDREGHIFPQFYFYFLQFRNKHDSNAKETNIAITLDGNIVSPTIGTEQ